MRFICAQYPNIELTVKSDIVKEVNGTIIKIPREIIKFSDGHYETEDTTHIEHIKKAIKGGIPIVIDELHKYQAKVEEVIEEVEHEIKKRGRPKSNKEG